MSPVYGTVFLVCYSYRKGLRNMTETYDIRWVRGHIEVFDGEGRFCFSADTMGEAQEELRDVVA